MTRAQAWKLIDNAVSLHTRLDVIYVVDGYEAATVREDETDIARAHADTVENAIVALAVELNKLASLR